MCHYMLQCSFRCMTFISFSPVDHYTENFKSEIHQVLLSFMFASSYFTRTLDIPVNISCKVLIPVCGSEAKQRVVLYHRLLPGNSSSVGHIKL